MNSFVFLSGEMASLEANVNTWGGDFVKWLNRVIL